MNEFNEYNEYIDKYHARMISFIEYHLMNISKISFMRIYKQIDLHKFKT